jgi:hypothetical protein
MHSETMQSATTHTFAVSSSDLAEKNVVVSGMMENEEMLVVDERASLRPAEMVESKLQKVLHSSVGVSQLRLRNLLARRI